MRRFWDKYENCIITMLTIVVNILITSVIFDYYYDLNDDVMMKDVMAGVYAGMPDGHNMQTLYLLGAFISLCYKICRPLPWYGLFLCVCQFGALFLIEKRLLQLCKKHWEKAVVMAFITLFIWGVLLPHIIALQYTITCSMLAMTAIFLFMTTRKDLPPKQFIVCNIPSVLLVILAYQLRSEMLLLVFPFICLAGLYRWAEEERFFHKDSYIKYGVVIAAILAGMFISQLTDSAAYSSEGWQEAVSFFDKRTQLYDFHYDVLTSGEHREELAAIGLSDAQQEVLANYNFGLDEKIDSRLMGEIADYAKKTTGVSSFSARMAVCLRQYIYRTLHSGDAPYNIIVIVGYLYIFISGIYEFARRHKDGISTDAGMSAATGISSSEGISTAAGNITGADISSGGNTDNKSLNFLWELILLGIVRSMLWMYILMNGREPERITHSLYMTEIMVLAGMICIRGRKQDICKYRITSVIYTAAVMLICLINIPQSITDVIENGRVREEANAGAGAIARYCRAHPENFYFEDVYSTVSFSQKIFKNVDNSLTNYDIMGGWMCKTPLYQEKLKHFGIESTNEALLGGNGAYFIIETGAPTEWLGEFYQDDGISVSLKQVELIDDKYVVYQVVEEE